MLKPSFYMLVLAFSFVAILTVNPGEIFSVIPAHIDAAYHSSHALLITKKNNVLFNASPYYEYPMAHLLQSILCFLSGLNLLTLHKILTILLCLFLFIIVFSSTKWLLLKLSTHHNRKNTILLSALIIAALYFTIYVQFSLTYSPQLYALTLLICFLNYCMKIHDSYLANKCNIFVVSIILTITITLAHHLTSFSLLIIAITMIVSREKNFIWKLVMLPIAVNFIYRCINTFMITFDLLKTLNIYNLINIINYHGHKAIEQKLSHIYFNDIIVHSLCYVKRIVLLLFSATSLYSLINNYVKRQMLSRLLRDLSKFWLKVLISFIIAAFPVITIAFERLLIYSGIVLTLAHITFLRAKLTKKYFCILVALLLISFISNIVPRIQNELLSPTGTLTKEYELAANFFLASKLDDTKPLLRIFTDLHNYHILKFILILYDKVSTLKISKIYHDKYDYITLLNYINNSAILLIHKRTIIRLNQFVGIDIDAECDLHELEVLYSSPYSNIVYKRCSL